MEDLNQLQRTSLIIRYNDTLNYSDAEFNQTIQSVLDQNAADWELNIVDETEHAHSHLDIPSDPRIKRLTGSFKNRAQAINRAVQESSGSLIMIVDSMNACVCLRRSTIETFAMVSGRNRDSGLIYSDYRRLNPDGNPCDVHLLNYHSGRLRDNMDLGPVFAIPRQVYRDAGGLDEAYDTADLYDLRLKISERYNIIHIQAAVNGFAYTVKAETSGHNVFDYLVASKDAQKEMENALTSHLKRTAAYLAPGTGYQEIRYTAEEEKQFENCIASVVIPVYNREEFIGIAVESVAAQTVQEVETIIVCNGGNEDPTIRAVRPYLPGGEKYDPDKPRVKLIVEDINNIGFCLNKGISQARGKYYVQLDSDDRLKPNAVEKIIEVFESDPRIGMVIGSYEVWKKDDVTGRIDRMEEIPVVTHDEWTEENGRNNLLRINGAGAPRSAHIKAIRELDGFGMNDGAHGRNYGEDYDMVLRISERYRIGRVWEPIYDVIRHAGGTDHAIDQRTIDRNDETKDAMRAEAIRRRIEMNRGGDKP